MKNLTIVRLSTVNRLKAWPFAIFTGKKYYAGGNYRKSGI